MGKCTETPSGIGGCPILRSVGVPPVTLGDDGQWAIDTVAKTYYWKTGGIWYLQFALTATGDKGDTGSTGATGAGGTTVVINDIGDVGTTAIITEEVLKTGNVPANTLDAAGDFIYVEADFKFGQTVGTRTVKLKWGGTLLMSIEVGDAVSALSSSTRFATFKTTIHRKTQTTQYACTEFTQFGLPSYSYEPFLNDSLSGIDLTGIVPISITGQNDVATVDDIVCTRLTITKLNKA